MEASAARLTGGGRRRNAALYRRIPPRRHDARRDHSPSKEDDLDTLTVHRPRKNIPLIADNFETGAIRRLTIYEVEPSVF